MSTNAESPYTFRPYVPDDINFIQSSWANSYYDGNNGHHQIDHDTFHNYHRPIRERALKNPNCAVIVCMAKSDPSTILGWILVEKPNGANFIKLHYIYVKAAFGGEGIATELLKMALPIRPVLYTHATIKSRRIIKENWKSGRRDYDRFLPTPHLI